MGAVELGPLLQHHVGLRRERAIGQPAYVPQNTVKNFQSRRNLRTVTNLAAAQVETANSSAPGGAYTPNGTSSMNLMTSAVNALFSYQPFFRFAAGKAREMMVKRGESIGHPWGPHIARLQHHDWEAEMLSIANPSLALPEYYTKPFHAYEKGNLSWEAAWEAEVAAKTVHAPIFDPEKSTMDPDGDLNLRRSYHTKMKTMLRLPGGTPRDIVDIGCSTGLSTFSLLEAFPEARLVGVDLSPYFLSVAQYRLREKGGETGEPLPIRFLHAAGEATGLPAESADLVSICLVCHELPRSATKKIIEEAHRLLRPGGALTIMEMNPNSPFLGKMVSNVFAFTAFKATEPYFDDYRTFPIEEAIAERGFEIPQQQESTPRHRTIVAHKL